MVLNDKAITLITNEEGFLVDYCSWNRDIACLIAKRNSITLTDAHWEIIAFIRGYYETYKHLPNTRVFTKAIANSLGNDKGNSRYLHQLFPEGPLKFACKIAGLPKPPNCL
jgi:tRNA 2-thiouridine synthesizing protein E